MKINEITTNNQSLTELAPGDNDGGNEDQLRYLASRWFHSDNSQTQRRIQKILIDVGYHIDYQGEEQEGVQLIPAGTYGVDWDDNDIIYYNVEDLSESSKNLNENLRKWFKEKWVRFGPDGKIRGACARGNDSEGKPKCLPQSKAYSLGKKARASAAARKRRQDPDPERKGAAINVNTKKKTNEQAIEEKWSQKYKNSVNCSHPKGFSQRAHCAGKKKHNESIEMEMTCPDCGMCPTHDKNQNLDEACWKGYHKEGNKKIFGKTYPNCVKNEGVAEEGYGSHPSQRVDPRTGKKYVPPKSPLGKSVAESQHGESCPHCGGEMVSEELMNEKKDACYYKVKSRYKVWPSAYASGALVKCRKKGASNWGNKNESTEQKIAGKYDPDEFDAMIDRLGKQAKEGARRTVWDPHTQRYKTVPVSRVNKTDQSPDVAEGTAKRKFEYPSPEQSLIKDPEEYTRWRDLREIDFVFGASQRNRAMAMNGMFKKNIATPRQWALLAKYSDENGRIKPRTDGGEYPTL